MQTFAMFLKSAYLAALTGLLFIEIQWNGLLRAQGLRFLSPNPSEGHKHFDVILVDMTFYKLCLCEKSANV